MTSTQVLTDKYYFTQHTRFRDTQNISSQCTVTTIENEKKEKSIREGSEMVTDFTMDLLQLSTHRGIGSHVAGDIEIPTRNAQPEKPKTKALPHPNKRNKL